MKKFIVLLFALALIICPKLIFAADNEGLHLKGMDKDTKKAKIETKKNTQKSEAEARKAEKQAKKELEKKQKEVDKASKKAKKEAEQKAKKAEKESKKQKKDLEGLVK